MSKKRGKDQLVRYGQKAQKGTGMSPESLAALEQELRAVQRDRGRHPTAEAWQDQQIKPARTLRFIGRPVISRTLNHVAEQWEGAAYYTRMNYDAIAPLGMRYVGAVDLENVKYWSQHDITEEVSNPDFRRVKYLGQITDLARADEAFERRDNLDQTYKVFGIDLTIQQYPPRDTSSSSWTVFGVRISTQRDTHVMPTDLWEERQYFMRTYDPYFVPKSSSALPPRLLIPVGAVSGIDNPYRDPNVAELINLYSGVLPAPITLGPTALIEATKG